MSIRRGCTLAAGFFICAVLAVFGCIHACTTAMPYERTYMNITSCEDGRFVASQVLISNGRRKNRTLAVCKEAPPGGEREWVEPFGYGEIELTDLRWTGPSTLMVECDDLDGDLPNSMRLKSVPIELVFEEYKPVRPERAR